VHVPYLTIFLWSMLLLCILLGGCGQQISTASGYFSSVKMDVEQVHDLEAQALQAAACNVTVGTLRRNTTGNPSFGDGVLLLCPTRASAPIPAALVRP
jgi:hypothetical protein